TVASGTSLARERRRQITSEPPEAGGRAKSDPNVRIGMAEPFLPRRRASLFRVSLGVGPGAGPALLFCLAGAAAGVVLSIKRNVAACRGVALWNLVAGLFFLLALSFARHPLVLF